MGAATDKRLHRRIAALGALALAVLTGWIVLRGGDDRDRTVRAAFREAVQVVPGQEVRIAGRPVGSVDGVREVDGLAVVDLRIGEADWPLRRGTTARLRYGSVSGYAGRFVDLAPGPVTAPVLRAGAVLGTASTTTPVEFDDVFSTFDAPTREDLAGVLDNAAGTVAGKGPELADALRRGSHGIDAYADLMRDLGARPDALRTLVRAGAGTAAALGEQDTALRALLRRAAGTFDELADRAGAQQAALDRLPGTLRTGGRTLRTLDRSLTRVDGLVRDLAPGARGLRAVAPPLRRTTVTLRSVAPKVTAALVTGRRAAPGIRRLLRAATPVLPQLTTVLDGLAPALGCIRPYAPEIAAFAGTWTGLAGADADGGYGRVDLTQLPPLVAAGSSLSAKQITDTFRDRVFYALPRPPGLESGDPWFLPECGAGRDALDPAKDPERRSGR